MTRNQKPSLLSQQIAGILRAQAAKFRLTQTEIAEAAGLSQSQLSKVFRATRVLDVDQLDALCRVLDLGIEDVVAEAAGEAANLWCDDEPNYRALVEEGVRIEVDDFTLAAKNPGYSFEDETT